MAPLVYLITPSDPDLTQFPRVLMAVLNGPEVSALLVRRGALDETAYATLCERLIQIGQAAGSAVLLEDDVDLARRLNADGVHITQGGTKAIREAVSALKPDGIVGAGNVRSRHDAMSFGELDVDYLMFGQLDGASDAQISELAVWWTETFEVPAVQVMSDMGDAAWAETTAEFVALSDILWAQPDPAAALKDLTGRARDKA